MKKNHFGVAHTKRVFNIAKQNFIVKPELQELTYTAIIFHDIGGSTIKDQYEKGPLLTSRVLKKNGWSSLFIEQVCEIISTHHEHPENPSEAFKVLYDSDRIVMFSPEEYPTYNSQKGFDWNKILNLIYTKNGRDIAKKQLAQRRKEQTTTDRTG